MNNKNIIVGVDEAGRGPLAGRVYASAVILNPDKQILGLKDSKLLSENQRNKLFSIICSNSLSYGIAYATHDEIDEINILQATFLAMKRAINSLNINFDYVLVDGNQYPFKGLYNGSAIIKGDNKIPEIMAASILAKVTRDNYMKEMDILFPNYNFSVHKGYPTKKHKELIKKYGPSIIHRKTFKGVKEFL